MNIVKHATPLTNALVEAHSKGEQTLGAVAMEYVDLAYKLESDRTQLIEALMKLHESKAMNAWAHDICKVVLAKVRS